MQSEGDSGKTRDWCSRCELVEAQVRQLEAALLARDLANNNNNGSNVSAESGIDEDLCSSADNLQVWLNLARLFYKKNKGVLLDK